MCGITGFCDFTKKTDKQTLIQMTDALHHRGPDDSGYSFYENEYAHVGLGHRRLSILDLSAKGHQPMSFENLEVVLNGEIYNFGEIRRELEGFGYTFNSRSDTEVVLKAYHKWGIKAVDKFIGMFAFGMYDKEAQKITLVRDRAGVKPLYYYQKDDVFLFASELKSFHQHPRFKKELSRQGVYLFFRFGYILEPYTIFNYAYKLKAGHYAEIDLKNKELKISKYWDVFDAYNAPKLDISFEEAKHETVKLLKSAFEYRMVSDVPVGMFLSGGYDSSAVTAILQKDRTDKLKTFTIGFHEEKYNEAHHAKKVAEHLGTDHTEYYCTQRDAQELLPLMGEIWDEPFGDFSNIPTTLVSRLARKYVTVSLSADGGDEIFGGYKKYTQMLKYKNILSKIPFKNFMSTFFSAIDPKHIPFVNHTKNFNSRYNKVVSLLGADNELEIMNSIVEYFADIETSKILNFNEKTVVTNFDEFNYLSCFNNDVDKLMAVDYKTYQLDDILVKVDRATMSVSLEGREPLLDHRIIEFVAKLPTEYKIKNCNKKYLLKSIVHDYIPQTIMERTKMGFSIPLNEWFGDDLKSYILEYLQHQKLKKVGVFNLEEIEYLKNIWLNNPNNSVAKLWLLLTFMMWYERWM